MRLTLSGDYKPLMNGITELAPVLGYEITEDGGIPLKIRKRPGTIKIRIEKSDDKGFTCVIEYAEKIHFFRALGRVVTNLWAEKPVELEEQPQFDMNGVMLDCSRNGVLRTETVKKMLRRMSLMGLNMLMLYTEDTYKVESAPYFGYMRGRYTEDELRECDSCAASLGIEMIPCIQTLSHLEKFLQWSVTAPVRDTARTLLADEKETYDLLEQMIESASAPFRSKRIHIGMDEASDVGLGAYLRKHGYRDPFSTIIRHLRRVAEITERQGLKPMMWSDMFFKFASPTHTGYQPETSFPAEILSDVPKQIQQVYWRYGTLPVETHRQLIEKHRLLSERPVFAGGVFTWGRFGTNYDITLPALENSLTACKKEGVKDTLITLWGDDGQEGNYFTGLLGLQYFAEHSYSSDVKEEDVRERIYQCTGIDYQAFMDISALNQNDRLTGHNNLAKSLLWQDPLLGLFDHEVEGLNLNDYFKKLADKLEKHRKDYSGPEMIFDVPAALARTLEIKSVIGLKLRTAYQEKDTSTLRQICHSELPELQERVNTLRQTHRRQWLLLNKAFGWEVLDIRYGGLANRCESTIQRLSQFLAGELQCLEELEEERLPFAGKARYRLLASACPIA